MNNVPSVVGVPPAGVPTIQQINNVAGNPRDAAINTQNANALNQVKINTLKGGRHSQGRRSRRTLRKNRCYKCGKRIGHRSRRSHRHRSCRAYGGAVAAAPTQYVVPQNHMLYNDGGLANQQMAKLAVLGGQNAANQRFDSKV
jgi:hypothetical protein